MGKRLPYTPNGVFKSGLRLLWLRFSRERRDALKRDNYTCQRCGRKQSKAKGRECKVEVHHKRGILNWSFLYEALRIGLFCGPEHLETLCESCHKEEKE